jgi:hypothetical protein
LEEDLLSDVAENDELEEV